MSINDPKQKSWWIEKSMQKLPVCLVAQSYLTLCNPMHCSSPNSSIGGLSFSCPGDFPNPGIKPRSPTLQLDSLPSKSQGKHPNSDNFHKYSMSRRGSITLYSLRVGCAPWFPSRGYTVEQEKNKKAVTLQWRNLTNYLSRWCG